ncbi:unnamed protein product [Macrosiphum euphorbiae]|uniref:Uncharacterized protein n=1 Tax=Macrosiphum euphorbiae TaxID=13131 RepID=A0AAV0X415_9HEMI|nr:unnamed protein product [Macrosiphum euphorbiae]
MSSDLRYQLHESPSRDMVTPPRHSLLYTIGESRHCIKERSDAAFRHNAIFVQIQYSVIFTLLLKKTNQKPKMGAEKVTMNIVVVGQVQSAKSVKSVAKATTTTNQMMVS